MAAYVSSYIHVEALIIVHVYIYLKPDEDYTYHVFIYHADADEEIALHMKKKLSEENYDVFVHADIEGNQSEYYSMISSSL
jgi:hypothetical protein